MELTRLSGTFGRLEGEELSFSPGLNLIEAPNEWGKSTWCALLRTMLYGLSTRERGAAADKNRYAPWSGRAMEGVMELTWRGRGITVARTTRRSNAPMGAFSAVYTGTATAAEELTAANCGQALTGVPRAVYERSAFIRQAGLPVSQDPELERRIASLITTGEEDASSYIEITERLKAQRNRRRHNRTGLLPQLEEEMAELERTLKQMGELEAVLAEAYRREEELKERQAAVVELLERHRRCDAAETAEAARRSLTEAEAAADALEARAAALPGPRELEALGARIAGLEGQREALDRSEAALDDTRRRRNAALDRLNALPRPAGPESAPPPYSPKKELLLGGILSAVLAILMVSLSLLPPVAEGTRGWPLPCWLLALPAALLPWAGVLPVIRRRRARAQADQEAWEAAQVPLSAERREAEQALGQADQEERAAVMARDRLAQALGEAEAAVLAEAAALAPAGSGLPQAMEAVTAGLALHRQALQARSDADAARKRWEAAGGGSGPSEERPRQSRESLTAALAETDRALADCRALLHTTQGRMAALGEPAAAEERLALCRERQKRLEAEYRAITDAMEALALANTALQNRFSPELGKKSAKLFAKLTGEKYNKVLLSRELAVSAEEAGALTPREIFQLSQGTADQLYLAVRLAICEMVLPGEDPAPLVLDDALANFDDRRMAAALDLLTELGQRRQILLFTCHSREGAYLRAKHPGAFRLAAGGEPQPRFL